MSSNEKFKRNVQIYKMRRETDLTLDEIGAKFGLKRQAVDVIVKRMAKKFGEEVKVTGSGSTTGLYSVKLGGFFATQEQADFIARMPGNNFSEKMRKVIQDHIDKNQ